MPFALVLLISCSKLEPTLEDRRIDSDSLGHSAYFLGLDERRWHVVDQANDRSAMRRLSSRTESALPRAASRYAVRCPGYGRYLMLAHQCSPARRCDTFAGGLLDPLSKMIDRGSSDLIKPRLRKST
jgi:hypothetical protein